ncbi:hypothetical protein LTR62_006865 [Meristemomyces frigidus]|uniref:LYR motif-containing protein Cup1-like N-terminal domain-containing protein n=1 Tax=Meristemomyces frigidus TaxID=1508187 RepID=A0AAN7TCH1_9PEZI|nr:hypothetical protein LTR62_006865 [Meristemomyces frigidus]
MKPGTLSVSRLQAFTGLNIHAVKLQRHLPLSVCSLRTLVADYGKQYSSLADNNGRASSTDHQQAKHWLRALLRECTYLPDAHLRQYMRKHVIARFESYRFKIWKHRDDANFQERMQAKVHEARSGIGLLRRANEGERKPLLKILLMAYGRIGKRRHELMLPLMPVATAREAETNTQSGADSGLQSPLNIDGMSTNVESKPGPSATEVNKGAWKAYAPDFTPQFRALLQSQIQTPPPHLTRPMLRRLSPRLEERNAWHRPMPLVRVKNQTKDWYADVLERAHPPLPKPEWQRLFELATGRRKETFVRRRPPVGLAQSSALSTIVQYGKPVERMVFGNRDAHQLTPRYMRRLWSQVFAQCPVMDWDSKKEQWTVKWGQQASRDHDLNVTTTSVATTNAVP